MKQHENSITQKYQPIKSIPIHKKKLRLLIFEIKTNYSVYLMAFPAMLLLFIFAYMPMFGLLVAFKNYNFTKGIIGSEWATPILNNFNYLFTQSESLRAVKNTLFLNLMFIVSSLIFEIGLALLMNEIVNQRIRKIIQSITFLPYFISWIVVGVFAYNMFNNDFGAINSILHSVGLNKFDFYGTPEIWPIILVLVARWKVTGYGSIIYMATLTGIDSMLYEAAKIDGATKIQQIRYISLPMLKPTVVILVLLSVGRIMNADFGLFYALTGGSPMLYSTTDVIDTFVYRSLRTTGDIGMASASGFMQSISSFVLVLGSNLIARKVDKDAALF